MPINLLELKEWLKEQINNREITMLSLGGSLNSNDRLYLTLEIECYKNVLDKISSD